MNKLASDTKITWKTWQLPVGFVFISVNSTNPATSLGYGTWELLDDGIFLKSTKTSSQINTKAGSASVSIAHTHTVAAHSHTVNSHTHSVSAHSHTVNSHSHTSANHKHLGTFGYDKNTFFCTARYGTNVVSAASTGGPSGSATGYSMEMQNGFTTPIRLSYTENVTPGNTGSSSPGTNSAGGGNTGSSSPGTNSAGGGNTGSAGGSVSVDPPHIKVYMWKRTA